jgi:hypothetical protein
MADKLVYKGGAAVVGQTGTDLQLVRPKRGGDVHRFPQWWDKKGTVKYIECAIFNVSLDNGEAVRLVVPHTDPGMTFKIETDGLGNFTFPQVSKGAIARVGVFAIDSNSLLVEYQFSKISGGSVLKRTLSPLPEPPPAAVAPDPTPEPEEEDDEP